MNLTTRPAALATEQAWRTQCADSPRFQPLAPERRISLLREQLEHLAVAAMQLEAMRVDIISASTCRDGLPQIEVDAADGERAFGPQATTCRAITARTCLRLVPVLGCLVYWHQPRSVA